MATNNNETSFDMSDLGSSLPAAAAALSAEDRAGLVNALKDKLQSLAGEDILETLSPRVRKRVDILREIQAEHDELEAKFFQERAFLEAKYQTLYEPFYAKRYEIVNGVTDVEGVKDEAAIDQDGDQATKEKGVPDFWLIALKTNEVVSEEITERDEGALKYLKDIKWSKLEKSKGFRLEFFFSANPYFRNSVLTKTYHMVDDDSEPILEKAIGTEIEWYPGKALTHKLLKKKPRKGSKNATPVTKTEDCPSFFNFFNPPEVPEENDDLDEEAAEELQGQMEQDYDIGSTIRDKIIPHATSWFTGEAAQGDNFEDSDDDEDDGIYDDTEDEDDDDDDEDGDEEDDEEDEEDEDKEKKKKSGKDQGAEGQQGERPAECKQQ